MHALVFVFHLLASRCHAFRVKAVPEQAQNSDERQQDLQKEAPTLLTKTLDDPSRERPSAIHALEAIHTAASFIPSGPLVHSATGLTTEKRMLPTLMRDVGASRIDDKRLQARSLLFHTRDSKQVLELLKEWQPQDKAEYTGVITAFLRARDCKRALETVDDMHKRGVETDSYTYNAVFYKAFTSRKLKPAISLLEGMRSRGIVPHLSKYNSLMLMFGSDWQGALSVFDQLRSEGPAPDKKSLGCVMQACIQGGQSEFALSLFDQMRLAGVEPDTTGFNIALEACEERWQHAVLTLDQMKEVGVTPNAESFELASHACEKAGQWERAKMLREEMRISSAMSLLKAAQATGDAPSLIAFNAAMAACEKSGDWYQLLSIFENMLSAGVVPDMTSFTKASLACAKTGLWRRATQLLDEMRVFGLTPNADIYSSAISACRDGNKLNCVSVLLDEMRSKGITPDAFSVESGIYASARKRQWLQALELLLEVQSPSTAHTADEQDKGTMSPSEDLWMPTHQRWELRPAAQVETVVSRPSEGPTNTVPAQDGLEGTWSYEGGEYSLIVIDQRHCWFEETVNSQKRSGVLLQNGEWYEGPISTGGKPLGFIRVRPSDGKLLSNSRSLSQASWGRDITALPKEQDLVNDRQGSSNSAAPTLKKSGLFQRLSEQLQAANGKLDEDALNEAITGEKPVLRQMHAANGQLDADALKEAISACKKNGQWQQALALLEQMRSSKSPPDEDCLDAAITACEKAGQWEHAKALFEEMREAAVLTFFDDVRASGVTPSAIGFNAAIAAREKRGELQEKKSLFDEMQRSGLVLTSERPSQLRKGEDIR